MGKSRIGGERSVLLGPFSPSTAVVLVVGGGIGIAIGTILCTGGALGLARISVFSHLGRVGSLVMIGTGALPLGGAVGGATVHLTLVAITSVRRKKQENMIDYIPESKGGKKPEKKETAPKKLEEKKDPYQSLYRVVGEEETQLETVEKYIERGGDPNQINPETGLSPVLLAVQRGDRDLVDYFINDMDVEDVEIDYDAVSSKGETILLIAVKNDRLKLIEDVLKKKRKVMDKISKPDENGWKPLHWAATLNLPLVKFIYEEGGSEDIISETSGGETPLQIATRLQEQGAKLDEVVNYLTRKQSQLDANVTPSDLNVTTQPLPLDDSQVNSSVDESAGTPPPAATGPLDNID